MISVYFVLKFWFWFFMLILVYHYIIFPIFLAVLSKFKKLKLSLGTNFSAEISILIPAHNEGQVIESKLLSILNGHFPLNKMEILIGSDASTDNTLAICMEMAKKYPQIKVYNFEKRAGKPEIINYLSQIALNEILIISDANVIFNSTTLENLIKPFENSQIGLSESKTENLKGEKKESSKQEKAYIRIEQFIKQKESEIFGQIMGPSGTCFAIRKSLYKPVPENFLVDDFFISMNVLLQKHFSVISSNSIVYEDLSNQLEEQFRRKKRIGTGNFQNLIYFKHLLHPRYKSIAFLFWSHKVIRWLSPLFLLLILLLSVCLVHETYFKLFLYLYLFSIFAALFDLVLSRFRKEILLLRFISHFYAMNSALFLGFVNYLKGVKTNVWQPTKRNHGK